MRVLKTETETETAVFPRNTDRNRPSSDDPEPLQHYTQPQSPRVRLPLSCFLFHVITYHLVHGLSASLPLKFGIPYLFTLGNHSHSSHSDAI